MKINDLKIGVRLGMLAGFLLLSILIVGIFGWQTLRTSDARMTEAMTRAALLENSVDTARKAQVDFKIQVQEWKDTLLRGNDPASFDKYKAAFMKKSDETQAGIKKLQGQLAALGLDTKQADDAQKAHQELLGKYLEALKQYDSAVDSSAHTVDKLVKGMDRPPTEKINQIVAYVLAQSDRMMKADLDAQAANYRQANLLSVIVIAVVMAAGAILTYFLMRSITVPLLRAVQIAKTVASGDLSTHVEVSGKDETGQLLQALKDMNDSLIQIVSEVRGGTNTIAGASAEIATGNLDLSARTEEQAGSLEETAAAMEQLTGTVKHNADNTHQANQMAVVASNVAVKGGTVVSEVIHTMSSINDSSKKIVDIIGVIDGIAFQTNILALNAAVEAARAGEQGRGFAVVASEVRNLAQRSASAAKEIKTLIGDSVEKVGAGTKLVDQAGTTMDEVLNSVRQLTSIISEIASANSEQTTGIEQINRAIVQMDQVTQQNAALVEEAAAAAESMKNQASHLEQVVSQFKLAGHFATIGKVASSRASAANTVDRNTVKQLPV
ncbi:MAG: HAMP domain-containing protein [Burkholderiales bacterium]|nr:HAMP domain-containing protein [Burkholderiales bacterium]